MKCNASVRLQIAIDVDADLARPIVDQSEWRDRPRRHAEECHEPIRRSETQPPVPDLIRYGTEIRALQQSDDHEVMTTTALVPQEQILRVRGVDAPPVRFGVSR